MHGILGHGLLSNLETVGLVLADFLYALIFLKFRTPSLAERKKALRIVTAAVILQSLAYAIAWMLRRSDLALWPPRGPLQAVIVTLLSLLLAIAGVALTAWAKKSLGRQWGLAARVVAGHKLVADGPFRYCRDPLYLGMAGLLLGTILGLSSLPGALGALVLFSPGTAIRVRAEEELLQETFGAEFENYRRTAPAFLPRLS